MTLVLCQYDRMRVRHGADLLRLWDCEEQRVRLIQVFAGLLLLANKQKGSCLSQPVVQGNHDGVSDIPEDGLQGFGARSFLLDPSRR